jgi:hypothetical protein
VTLAAAGNAGQASFGHTRSAAPDPAAGLPAVRGGIEIGDALTLSCLRVPAAPIVRGVPLHGGAQRWPPAFRTDEESMPDTIRCPDCGHENPPGSTSCARCNYPLNEASAETPPSSPPASEPEIVIRRPVRRPRPMASQSMTLWLVIGFIAAAAILWQALVGYHRNNAPPVAGANQNQQQEADSLRNVLSRDSTNVDALVALGNVLYDTGNWPEAAKFYARGIALDSNRVQAIVDMGVCFYNQSDPQRAQELFLLALQHDPGQPVALFNLGIVNESAGDADAALRYFHRALEADSPEEMKQQIVQHMSALLKKTGRAAPPLNPGAMPPGTPPGDPSGR